LKGKHFLKLSDYHPSEILYLLHSARELKQQKTSSELSGKILGMIFEKPSTRTRVSFEAAMLQLGGHAIYLNANDLQLRRGEPLEDTAKVLSRFVDGIMIRAFSHQTLEILAEHATVPVINGLTNLHHPAQVLADLLTIWEHKGTLQGLKLCYVGDGNNNVTHSLIEGAALVGMNISVASPPGYEPDESVVVKAREIGQITGSTIEILHSPIKAVQDADVIVTDVWISMGLEQEREERLKVFVDYQVNAKLCSYAKNDFIFLHCLPAVRGEEVTSEIIDGPHSVVFDEAENRLHAQKAILKALLA
jgi:ornithine carbamoyltransferase